MSKKNSKIIRRKKRKAFKENKIDKGIFDREFKPKVIVRKSGYEDLSECESTREFLKNCI